MENKCCSKCGLEKPLTDFYLDRRNKNNIKPKSKCILCEKEDAKIYREINKDKISKRIQEWSLNNKDKKRLNSYKWRDNNPDKVKEIKNLYTKNRRKTDVLFRLTINLRTMINNSFRKRNLIKNSKTNEILGCSFEEFKIYLESKFESWMTWDNHGLYNGTTSYGWDIDHDTPTSSANTEAEVIKLNHYTNLKPLCSYINRNVKRNNLF